MLTKEDKMRQGKGNPTTLHYAICKVADRWVLGCEHIPIACFDTREAAKKAAKSYMAAARRRGDCPYMESDSTAPTPPQMKYIIRPGSARGYNHGAAE
jgi:hypothetical protein